MNNKKYKVGIYLRLSNEDKNKDESESIKNQRKILLDYIGKNKDFIYIDEYCDENYSGAGTYRPEFERLIKDCELKKIDIVLCKSQSRFSRDLEIIEKYLNNKFKEWNTRFISLTDNIDTENYGNKKSRQINGLVNEWFLEDTSNNIRSALKAKMQSGEYISPFTVYGYKISTKNKITIDIPASIIVRKIFKLYLSGKGYTQISNYLNEKKIPSPSLYKYQNGIKLNIVSNKKREEILWNPNAIKTILTNEIYIGNLLQGKRKTISYKNHKIIKQSSEQWIRHNNTHPPIINETTYKKVQSLIKKKRKTITNKKYSNIFSGLVICEECEHKMKIKRNKKYTYLVCSNKECINTKGIRYDILEDIVLRKINKYVKKYYNEKIIKKYMNDNINNDFFNKKYIHELNKIKIRKEEIILYKKKLFENIINNNIEYEDYKLLNTNYKEELTSINNKIKLLESTIKDNEKNYSFNRMMLKDKRFDNLNKIILDEFINKIYISNIINKNKRIITIYWNF